MTYDAWRDRYRYGSIPIRHNHAPFMDFGEFECHCKECGQSWTREDGGNWKPAPPSDRSGTP